MPRSTECRRQPFRPRRARWTLPQLVQFQLISVPSTSCQTPYALGCRWRYWKLIYIILLMFSPIPCGWGSHMHALQVKSRGTGDHGQPAHCASCMLSRAHYHSSFRLYSLAQQRSCCGLAPPGVPHLLSYLWSPGCGETAAPSALRCMNISVRCISCRCPGASPKVSGRAGLGNQAFREWLESDRFQGDMFRRPSAGAGTSSLPLTCHAVAPRGCDGLSYVPVFAYGT